jgi:hypothetical protein
MPDTSRALLSELIDYAGLFPPAKLPMDEAFARFLGHLTGDDGWLLARFVCPSARLGDLAPLIDAAGSDQGPIRVAVLGSGGDDPPSFADGLEADVDSMATFGERLGGRAVVDVFEVMLPAEGDPAEVVDLCFDNLGNAAARIPRPFFEIPMVGERPDPLTTASAIASAAHEIDPARRAGLKIRCGGLEAAAVPAVEAVAAAVNAALSTGLALKATQGLHHPLRGEDPSLGTVTHGFFNLLAAAILANEHLLDEDRIRAVIAEEDPETFRLDDDGLHWRDLGAGFSGIVETRLAVFTGFGSCSFSEPRDDLADLGWL